MHNISTNVGHTSMLITPRANMVTKIDRYHHSGTTKQDKRELLFCVDVATYLEGISP